MTKNELFAEYCNEYPLILGYREVSYEDWLEQQVIENRTQVVDTNNTSLDDTRKSELLISFSEYLHKRGYINS